MEEFADIMNRRYDIKRLGRPKRYLGCNCHYHEDSSMALSQRIHIDKALQDAEMLDANGKHTPFSTKAEYHASTEDNVCLPQTLPQYRKLVGALRYIADSTRPDIG